LTFYSHQVHSSTSSEPITFGPIVVELKTLKVDPSPKIEATLSQHRDRTDFPIFYGQVELSEILQHLPDGDQINQRIYRNISRSIEDAVRSAETQISDTEEIFNLSKAVGLLVLLNENIDVLNPHAVVYRVSELLTRQRTDGSVHTSIVLFGCCSRAMPYKLLTAPLAQVFSSKDQQQIVLIGSFLSSARSKLHGGPLTTHLSSMHGSNALQIYRSIHPNLTNNVMCG
jgi:hypothetical protein